VQFSVDQIRALSSASQPVPLQAAPSMSSIASSRMSTSSGTAGYASGDGSGLIDVRKLAEMHAAMTAQESPRAEIESSSLIPSHGSYAHTLAPLSLPLPPSAAQSGGIDGKTKLIAGLAAFGMVLAAAVGVLALTRPLPQAEVASATQPIAADHVVNGQPADEPKVAAAEETEEAKPEVAQADKEEPAADGEQATAEASDEGDSETASRSSSKRSKRSKSKAKGDDDSEPVAKADKKEEKKEKPSAKDSIDDLLADGPAKPSKSSSAGASIDDLLDNAVSGKKSAPKAEEKPASNLPQTPSREDMLGALGKAKAKAAKCKGPGVATAAIQIAGSGKVSSVSVTGAEGAAAACVEKAVRSTPFPKFQKDSFEVKFPFKLGS
jgi:hypothetical protein